MWPPGCLRRLQAPRLLGRQPLVLLLVLLLLLSCLCWPCSSRNAVSEHQQDEQQTVQHEEHTAQQQPLQIAQQIVQQVVEQVPVKLQQMRHWLKVAYRRYNRSAKNEAKIQTESVRGTSRGSSRWNRRYGEVDRGSIKRERSHALLGREQQQPAASQTRRMQLASLIALASALLLAIKVLQQEKRLSREEARLEGELEQQDDTAATRKQLEEAGEREQLTQHLALQEMYVAKQQQEQTEQQLWMLQQRMQMLRARHAEALVPMDEQAARTLEAAKTRLAAAREGREEALVSLEAFSKVHGLEETEAKGLLTRLQEELREEERNAALIDSCLTRGRQAKTVDEMLHAKQLQLYALEREIDFIEDELQDWQETKVGEQKRHEEEETALDGDLNELKELQTELENRTAEAIKATESSEAEKQKIEKEMDEIDQLLQRGLAHLDFFDHAPDFFKRKDEMLKKATEMQQSFADELHELVGAPRNDAAEAAAAAEVGQAEKGDSQDDLSGAISSLYPEEAQLLATKKLLRRLHRRKSEVEAELATFTDTKERTLLAKAIRNLVLAQADAPVVFPVDLVEDSDSAEQEPSAEDTAEGPSGAAAGEGGAGGAEDAAEDEETVGEGLMRAQEEVDLARHRLREREERRQTLEAELRQLESQIAKAELQQREHQRQVQLLRDAADDKVKFAVAHAIAEDDMVEQRLMQLEKALKMLQNHAAVERREAERTAAVVTGGEGKDREGEKLQQQQRQCEYADDGVLMGMRQIFEQLLAIRLAERTAHDDIWLNRQKEDLLKPNVFKEVLQQAVAEGPSSPEQRLLSESWAEWTVNEIEKLQEELKESKEFTKAVQKWLIAITKAENIDLHAIHRDHMEALTSLLREQENQAFCEQRLKVLQQRTPEAIRKRIEALFMEALRERERREALFGESMEAEQVLYDAHVKAIQEQGKRLRRLRKLVETFKRKYAPLEGAVLLHPPGDPRPRKFVHFPTGSNKRFAGEAVPSRPQPSSVRQLKDGFTVESYDGILQLSKKSKASYTP
ncbi:hypothetical protein, conserved [Eimeria maxima]|uniref:Uncharacterized protein n=1 Tax=Eimeria maxima TaxID=5804 RepID=U6M2I1_EIMMA|nr:hypothetical protein, conserved [Eimeria maxima]CDJ58442.1 hypothetical protein, conserved [Eimeria maxima]